MQKAIATALFLAGCLLGSTAIAAPTPFEIEQAKVLATEGLALFDKGEFQDALAKLEEADRVSPIPTIGIFAARCLDKLGRLVEAKQRYRKVIDAEVPANAPPQWAKAKEDAQAELAVLAPRIANVEIASGSPDPSAKLMIDGAARETIAGPHELDPGAHLIELVIGSDTYPATVDLKEGERRKVHFDPKGGAPKDATEDELNLLDVIGWSGVGVGGALLIVWAGTGGAALDQAGDQCNGDACSGDVAGLQSLRTASAVTFWVGLPIGIGGAALLVIPRLLDGDSAPAGEGGAAAWEPVIGPAYLGMKGRF